MITQRQLKEVLNYNKETGVFTWITRTARSVRVGEVAGGKMKEGHVRIRVCKGRYLAHRLAWLYVYGEMPSRGLDHINGVTDDNRITNLRCVSQGENMKNKSTYKTSSSGFTGVSWRKDQGKWESHICLKGKTKYLGQFHNLSDAVKCRLEADVTYGFHDNHGRNNL